MPGGDQGDWLNKLAGKKITTEAVGGVDVSLLAITDLHYPMRWFMLMIPLSR